MQKSFLSLSLACLFFVAGCATTGGQPAEATKETERDFSKQGTVTKEVVKVNSRIRSELHRVLDGVVIEGKGSFSDAREMVARNAALTIALNDMAKRAGQVLLEEDTTIYNDEVKSILRTRARNIVKGYVVMVDVYDPDTQTSEIIVRQEGERVASEIAKEIILNDNSQ
jgi:hypothetical protein